MLYFDGSFHFCHRGFKSFNPFVLLLRLHILLSSCNRIYLTAWWNRLFVWNCIVVEPARRWRNRQNRGHSERRIIFWIGMFCWTPRTTSDGIELSSTAAFCYENIVLFYSISALKYKRLNLLFKLPWQHSAQNLKSTLGISLQLTKLGDCSFGSLKTSLVISRISSLLSHITRPNVDCRICVSCSGLKTPGFSYQNLKSQLFFYIELIPLLVRK